MGKPYYCTIISRDCFRQRITGGNEQWQIEVVYMPSEDQTLTLEHYNRQQKEQEKMASGCSFNPVTRQPARSRVIRRRVVHQTTPLFSFPSPDSSGPVSSHAPPQESSQLSLSFGLTPHLSVNEDRKARSRHKVETERTVVKATRNIAPKETGAHTFPPIDFSFN